MQKNRKFLFLLFGILAILVLVSGSLTLAGFHFLSSDDKGTSMSTTDGSQTIHAASHNLAPIVSNQWYSNIYAQFPTEPLYALPAAFQLSPQGVGISFPQVTKTANSIFAPYIMDLQVGFSNPLQKPSMENIGDWSIGLAMTTSQHEQLQFTLAHGVPSTVFHVTGSQLQITCGVPCDAYSNNITPLAANTGANTQALSLVIRGHSYILVFDAAHAITFTGSALSISGATRVFVGILDTRAHYNLFENAASTEILSTAATPVVNGNQLTTSYALATSGASPLIALYPHQLASLSAPLPVLGTYASIRGTLSLVQTNSFTTTLPIQLPGTDFPALKTIPADLRSSLISDIDSFIQQGPPGSKDYFLGVWFGCGSNLLQLAQALGMKDQEQRLLQYLEPEFAQSMSYFAYDPTKNSVIAQSPEFGNQNLNDHHFHYGYFIRTAAVLGQFDPAFVSKVETPVNQMVQDIANYQRTSSQFPYLRPFDVYEGHSWADGFAKFADGNDQESTSEAIQAWYGLYLWSQVTHDTTLHTTALFLYTTEIQSVKTYWFGLNGLYNGDYQHAIASIVWGGKVDFATWFSSDPNQIYGIQLLPVTPGTDYLGQLPAIEPYLADLLAHGGGKDKTWGDLLLIWESYYHPDQALAQKDSVPVASMNSPRSLLLYMLYAHAQ